MAFLRGDDDAHAAHDAFTEQQRPGETRFRRRVVDDHRSVGKDGVPSLGVPGSDGRSPNVPFLPADACPQEQLFAVRQQLQDLAVFDVERLCDEGDRFVQHVSYRSLRSARCPSSATTAWRRASSLISSSARLRSVMSLTKALKVYASPFLAGEMLSSIGT